MIKNNWTTSKKIIIVSLALLLVLAIPNISRAITIIDKQMEIIQELYSIISTYHVDDIDPEVLTKGAIDGMINALDDPYTTYFTDEEYASFLNDIDGSFTGVGMYVEEKDNYVIVQAPIPGSPAEKAGLLAGDKIIKVNDIDVVGKKLEEVVSLIRGEAGTVVIITVKRNQESLTKEIVRQKITLPITETKMLSDKIGYLRLYSFGSQSALEFKNSLEQLKDSGMEKLVLDLRANPGGYLNAVLEISKNFITEGPIVYVKDKNQTEQALEISGGAKWDLPIVVLVDRGSASASEILAAALDDYDKATIIGENSFGKGTVQNMLALPSGGYLKITVNEYFTPNKTKINGIGVAPDVEVLDPDNQLAQAISYLSDGNMYIPVLGDSWIKDEDKDYIAIRQLTDYFGGKTSWNAKTRLIEISLADKQVQIHIDSLDLLVINGKSYLSIEALEAILVDISIEQFGSSLNITLD